MTAKHLTCCAFLLLPAGLLRAQAPLSLTGTSYFQGFDSVGKGLPPGWELDSAATPATRGFAMQFDTARVGWSSTSGRGKNFAAKGTFAFAAGVTTAAQNASANRCFGLRQTAALDSGVAYTLTLAQTAGLSGLALTFNLQSLDSGSGRTTAWQVQYGIGAAPTAFVTVPATGTLATGGNTFSSSTVTASFGTALDNRTGPVVLRIVSLAKTGGSGSRASTGLDSLTLSWTGTAVTLPRPAITALAPANGATNVPATSTLAVTFDRQIAVGTSGALYLRNRTDGVTTAKPWGSPDISLAGKTATIANAGLLPGKSYAVTFDSTLFDTAAYHSYGLYDTTAWTFTTAGSGGVPTVTYLNENFSAACAAGGLPAGWSRQDVAGAQQWTCYSTSGGNAKLEMYGAGAANEDWLITPRLNVSGYAFPGLRFEMNKRFAGPELRVLLSADYDGSSAPATATWTDLQIPFDPADTAGSTYRPYTAALAPYKATPFFLAFKYTSGAAGSARIRLDTVTVFGTTGIDAPSGAALPVTVLGPPEAGGLTVAFTAPVAGLYTVTLVDLLGRTAACQALPAVPGAVTRLDLRLPAVPPGLYSVRVAGMGAAGWARAVVR